MVKWKKMNKKMAGIMLGVMMLFTASTTAFAYVDESAEASKTEVTQTEQTVSQEEAQTEEAAGTDEVLPENTDSNACLPARLITAGCVATLHGNVCVATPCGTPCQQRQQRQRRHGKRGGGMCV
ncbi:hypothetical protein [Eubacterium ramulus]|uniref:hypothetical protein n=1 Tax=Eubacterium ramulus TaxID=39490 RepID=UPI00399B4295